MSTTCQICEREIKLVHGKIAHHGYQRPGTGWQSASCEGARELPWEVSCDVLRRHVEAVQTRRARLHVLATGPVTQLSLQIGTESRYSDVPKMITVTEETLLTVAAEHKLFARYNGVNFYSDTPLPWPQLVERYRKERLGEVAQLNSYLHRQERRLETWSPAHAAQ